MASGEPHFYQACYKDAPSNVNTDSGILDDEDLAMLIDGCFSDDDDLILSNNLDEDVENNNVVTENDSDTQDDNNVDNGRKGTEKLACTDNCIQTTDIFSN